MHVFLKVWCTQPWRYDACIPKGLMHIFLKLCCTHSQRYVACTHKGIKNILLKLLCTHSQKYDTHWQWVTATCVTHALFFHENVPFFLVIGDFLCDCWWFFGWDWGTPAILQHQNHPFIWLWFWFEKVGIWSDTHPPHWEKIPTFTEIFFGDSPYHLYQQWNVHIVRCTTDPGYWIWNLNFG